MASNGSVSGLVTPAFVGRERELAELRHVLRRPPAVALVEGEAGVGKSRLIQEFLADREHRALVGTCLPYRESLPLGAVVDAAWSATKSVAGLHLSALAGALRPLFPEWAADLPPAPEPLADARAARHRLFRALVDLFGRLEVSVLVVEDVHWADEATLEFVLFLVSRQPSPSVMVSYRPEDVAAGSMLLRLSSRPLPGLTRVRLSLASLDESGTACLASSMLDGAPLSDAFAAFLHARTDGLPLAVEESVRLLYDRADLVRHGGEWRYRGPEQLRVPPTVRDAVRERLPRLGEATRRVVEAGAVLAEPVAEAVLGRVADLGADQAQSAVSGALGSGLLREYEDGRLGFRHALMGQAVYETITGPQRRRLHLAAGGALESTEPPPLARLVHHFREADDVDKWCRYAEQAAESAAASHDHSAVVMMLGDVLASAKPDRPVQARLVRKLVTAALVRYEGPDQVARRVVETVRAILDSGGLTPVEQAEVRNRLGRLLMMLGEWEDGHRELERAAVDLGQNRAEAAQVMTYLGLPFASSRPASVHRRWLRRAAALETWVESPMDRAILRADRATALLGLGEPEGWDLAATLPTAAATNYDQHRLTRAYVNLAAVATLWGRDEEARRLLETARSLAEAAGWVRDRYRMRGVEAHLDLFSAAWSGLAERLDAMIKIADEVPSSYHNIARAMGWLAAARGRRRDAEDWFRRSLDEAIRQGAVDDALQSAAALGRLRLDEARIGDALSLTDEPMGTLMTKGIWLWATGVAPVRTEALVAAGRIEEATDLVARFGRGLRGRDAPAPRAALAMCRAILAEGSGEHARAAAAFARTARRWGTIPRPYDALLARERQARCALLAGRPETGLAVMSDVFQGLSDLGAHGDADRVAGRLREHGVVVVRGLRRGRRGYGDQLSPRELEVVLLVVEGRTNRQIAQVLSKSPSTVDGQLNAAMRKLGVSTRTALAVSAVETGLVSGDHL